MLSRACLRRTMFEVCPLHCHFTRSAHCSHRAMSHAVYALVVTGVCCFLSAAFFMHWRRHLARAVRDYVAPLVFLGAGQCLLALSRDIHPSHSAHSHKHVYA